MRTVQLNLDEELIEAVDRAAERLQISRLAFVCNTLRDAVNQYDVARLEQQHRAGYEKFPVARGEFWASGDENS